LTNPGWHTLTASATDSYGQTGRDQTQILVVDGAAPSSTVTGNTATGNGKVG
jgi:hypothetical protein